MARDFLITARKKSKGELQAKPPLSSIYLIWGVVTGVPVWHVLMSLDPQAGCCPSAVSLSKCWVLLG